jgi:hypothetical protein
MAARLLVRYFVERVQSAEDDSAVEIDAGVLRYLADAFARFLEGKDSLESSVGVRKRRHRAWLKADTPDIVREYYALEATLGKRGALKRTAQALGLDRGRVKYFVYG